MDTCGHPTRLASGLIIITGIGFTQIMDGRGYRTTIGAGRHSIMAVGFMMTHMAGCGYPAMNGRRPGFHGEVVVIIMVGLH